MSQITIDFVFMYLQNIAGFKTRVLILDLLYKQLGLFPTYLFSLEPRVRRGKF